MASLGSHCVRTNRPLMEQKFNKDKGHLQHDKVCDGKLKQMQQRPDGLLEERRAERRRDRNAAGAEGSRAFAAVLTARGRIVARSCKGACACDDPGGVGADEVAVVLLAGAAEGLEGQDEEHDAYAGAGKHAGGRNVPRLGDEARVDCLPVPEHLWFRTAG